MEGSEGHMRLSAKEKQAVIQKTCRRYQRSGFFEIDTVRHYRNHESGELRTFGPILPLTAPAPVPAGVG
jgi:hypothetical protein